MIFNIVWVFFCIFSIFDFVELALELRASVDNINLSWISKTAQV